jgi:Ni/Co efflux regulator RcnB
MKNLIKRCATLVVLTTAAASIVPASAMAERTIVEQYTQGHSTNVKVVKKTKAVKKTQVVKKAQPVKKAQVAKKQRHTQTVGHRFRKQDVVVINDWHQRGLPRPNRNEVYVVNGDSIYLAAAASLLVKALIN